MVKFRIRYLWIRRGLSCHLGISLVASRCVPGFFFEEHGHSLAGLVRFRFDVSIDTFLISAITSVMVSNAFPKSVTPKDWSIRWKSECWLSWCYASA